MNSDFFVDKSVDYALENSDVIFYCVGTPYGDDGSADLRYINNAILQTLNHIKGETLKLLVIKSTVPPGTTNNEIRQIIENQGFEIGKDLLLANNPEFLREGTCWSDFIHADRIVVGCEDENTKNIMNKLYFQVEAEKFFVSLNTAEFIKYLSNSLLATLISYSNEMSLMADKFGDIQIKDAFKILHLDRRWEDNTMKSYFYPGVGYGGYCLPKDTQALYSKSVSMGFNPKILGEVIRLNEIMPLKVVEKIESAIGCNFSAKIGILGLSFKPNTDDVRDSTSSKIISLLNSKGYNNIFGFDPIAGFNFRQMYDLKFELLEDLVEIKLKSDVLVLITPWKEIIEGLQNIDKVIIDGRYAL